MVRCQVRNWGESGHTGVLSAVNVTSRDGGDEGREGDEDGSSAHVDKG